MPENRTQYIGQMPVSDLIPYARNARTHSPEQVQQIAASIKEFGFLNPVIVSDNDLVAGHGRVLAAELLGWKTIPAINASYLTEEQRRAYIIADNQIALNSDWDKELLRIEIADLNDLEFKTDVLGFSLDQLSDIGFDDLAAVDLPDLSTKREPFQQRSFHIHDKQIPVLDQALSLAKALIPQDGDYAENPNSSGNALVFMAEEFIRTNGKS